MGLKHLVSFCRKYVIYNLAVFLSIFPTQANTQEILQLFLLVATIEIENNSLISSISIFLWYVFVEPSALYFKEIF